MGINSHISAGITASTAELNILDASAVDTDTSNMDTLTGTLTSNKYKISHQLTLAAALSNGASLTDISIISDKVLVKSAVLVGTDKDVTVDVHTITGGSFKVNIKNTSGGTLADDSSIVLNYVIL